MDKLKGFMIAMFKFLKVILFSLLPFIVFISCCLLIIFILGNSSIKEYQIYFLSKKFLTLSFTFITLGIIIFIFYLLVKIYKKFSFVAGQNFYSKILSLGIVGIIYFKSIKALLFPFYFLVQLGIYQFNDIKPEMIDSGVSEVIQPLTKTTIQPNDTNNIEKDTINLIDCYNLVLDQTNLWFKNTVQHLRDLIMFANQANSNYLRDFIIALFLLFIFGKLSDIYSDYNKTNQEGIYISVIRQWFINYKSSFFLVLIIVFSLFLCISSIITIPVIRQGEETKGMSPEDFEKVVQTAFKNNSYLDTSYYSFSLNTAYVDTNLIVFKRQFDPTSIKIDKSKNQEDFKVYEKYYGNSIKNLTEISYKYKLLNKQWKEGINKYFKKIESEKNNIIIEYKNSSLTSFVGNERINYFSESIKSLNEYMRYYKGEIDYNYSKLQSLEGQINSYIVQLLNQFTDNKQLLMNLTDNSQKHGYALFEESFPFNFSYYELNNEPSLIQRPELVNDKPMYGIFGWISNWLIRTKSNEMAIIIGMLGFGLLGAAISSLFKDRKEEENVGLFKNNIATTIMSGFTAALVIFLSVKGGMVIFATSETNLNQYALFFLCLIGSVFSEKVWQKAQNYLK